MQSSFLTSYVFIFPQDTWDNFGMNVQQVVEESEAPSKDVTSATDLRLMSIIPFSALYPWNPLLFFLHLFSYLSTQFLSFILLSILVWI